MPEKVFKTSFLPRDENFYELIKILKRIKWSTELNKPKFTVGDTHLSYRVISHWGKHGLLPEGVGKDKGWHKFNLVEMVWLKVASRLRAFGFSLDKIAEIKKQIMWFDKKNKYRSYPFLELYVARAWLRGEDPYVIVLADGMADVGSFLEIERAKKKLSPNQKDMLLISLRSILEEMGLTLVRQKTILTPMSLDDLLNLEALDAVVKNKESTTLKFKKGRLEEVENTDTIAENPDLIGITRLFKKDSVFGEITAKFADGKRQSVIIKRRQRLR